MIEDVKPAGYAPGMSPAARFVGAIPTTRLAVTALVVVVGCGLVTALAAACGAVVIALGFGVVGSVAVFTLQIQALYCQMHLGRMLPLAAAMLGSPCWVAFLCTVPPAPATAMIELLLAAGAFIVIAAGIIQLQPVTGRSGMPEIESIP